MIPSLIENLKTICRGASVTFHQWIWLIWEEIKRSNFFILWLSHRWNLLIFFISIRLGFIIQTSQQGRPLKRKRLGHCKWTLSAYQAGYAHLPVYTRRFKNSCRQADFEVRRLLLRHEVHKGQFLPYFKALLSGEVQWLLMHHCLKMRCLIMDTLHNYYYWQTAFTLKLW